MGLRELRQNASELVRRAEAGDEITITVAGRPAARLVSASKQRWRRREDVADILAVSPDPTWETDRDLIDHSIRDPWAPR